MHRAKCTPCWIPSLLFFSLLLFFATPFTASMEVNSPSAPIAIKSPGEKDTDNKPRFIITARALDEMNEAPPIVSETEHFEAGQYEDQTEQSLSGEVTSESDETVSSEAPTSITETAAPSLNSATLSSESTTPLQPQQEQVDTRASGEQHDVEEDQHVLEDGDLNASAANVDIQVRRNDQEEDSAQLHPLVYARVKHPIQNQAPSNDPSVSAIGSIFGRPYNARPFQLPARTTTERALFPTFQKRPTPDGDSIAHEIPSWNNNRAPNRWEKEKAANQRFNMTRVLSVDAECQNDYMKIRIRFNGSFSGIIYSSGFAYDPLCVYVNGTGRDYYEFYIQLNRCGTLGGNTHNLDSRKQPTKSFMWNTLSIQYSPLIEEEWDEHYKMTCEYGYDYWKTVTFPFLDVEVATGNPLSFTLTPPECHMEIRSGYGTTGTRVTGPVRVGDPLTLVVYMRSQFDGFDVIVSNCYAHNGATKKIQLIDDNGCPINEKLISRFRGTWTDAGLYETQVFAYMKAFRFTGSPALYIECDVRMCHGHCPTQPCYWRNSREITKRDVKTEVVNTTLSENLSLFQSLQVIADDEPAYGESQAKEAKASANKESADQICMKPVAVGALIGLACLICMGLGITLCILCVRLRRRTSSETAIYTQQYATPSFGFGSSKDRHFS